MRMLLSVAHLSFRFKRFCPCDGFGTCNTFAEKPVLVEDGALTDLMRVRHDAVDPYDGNVNLTHLLTAIVILSLDSFKFRNEFFGGVLWCLYRESHSGAAVVAAAEKVTLHALKNAPALLDVLDEPLKFDIVGFHCVVQLRQLNLGTLPVRAVPNLNLAWLFWLGSLNFAFKPCLLHRSVNQNLEQTLYFACCF